jgi:hypothetical protein
VTALNTALGNIVRRTAFFYSFGSNKIGFVQLDCTVNETHTRTAKVTSNEVEDGSNVADNIVLSNEAFSLEGIISEAPFPSNDIRDVALRVQNAGFNFLSEKIGAISNGVITDAGATTKRIVALIQLENFWKNKIPFTVITGLKKYDNVVIKQMNIPVNYKDGKSLRFQIDCEVIKIVESQTVSVPKNFAKNRGIIKNQNLGKQGTTDASLDESRRSSVLFKLYKGATG